MKTNDEPNPLTMPTMTLTKGLAITLAFGGLISGLLAAWFWERTTRVRVDLFASDAYAMPAAGDDISEPLWWTPEVRADQKIARLNTLAARCTAVAVVLGTLSSVVGLF